MASLLYGVGRFAFRRRWYVLFAWLAVLGGVIAVASVAPAAPADSSSIPGAEFSTANNLIQQKFHANPNGASAQIVFVAPHGQQITATKEVVGEAADGKGAAEMVRTHHPDVVVMDIRMPGTDGLAATEAICAYPSLAGTRILILTTFETDEYVARALRAGASGFLGKTASTDQLLDGVRTIAAGDSLLSPQATRALIGRFLASPEPGGHLAPSASLAELTAREREVMALAAEGYSNDDIAAKLYLSTHTVRTHIHRTMMKLHARDRAQLVVIAYQGGLVRVTPPPG